MGQSQGDGRLAVPPRPGERLPLAQYEPTELRVTPYGLLLYYNQTIRLGSSVTLDLTYHPNQGLDEQAKVTASLSLSS
ncbi:hypothetical protein ABIC75_004510 [Dyella japonica]|uniref:Uncharacterized protein n=1 Tax=Dyella japonica TaxID=231455 RepID=A0ABV2K114_9GAMM